MSQEEKIICHLCRKRVSSDSDLITGFAYVGIEYKKYGGGDLYIMDKVVPTVVKNKICKKCVLKERLKSIIIVLAFTIAAAFLLILGIRFGIEWMSEIGFYGIILLRIRFFYVFLLKKENKFADHAVEKLTKHHNNKEDLIFFSRKECLV